MSHHTIVTYKIAMAISRDAAERRRREAGRESWNADDFACAAEAFQKCVPLMEPHERARYDESLESEMKGIVRDPSTAPRQARLAQDDRLFK
jgi:hypothetical protein